MRAIRGASYDDGRVQTVRGDLPRPQPVRAPSRLLGERAGPIGPASPAHESVGARARPRWFDHFVQGVRRFFDKGARTFRRTDALILEDLCEALGDQHPDARNIEVTVANGVVRLGGNVDSRSERWMAADVAAEILGVQGVVNQIRIGR